MNTKLRNIVTILSALAVVTSVLAFGKQIAIGNTFGAASFALLGIIFLGGFVVLRRGGQRG